MCMPANRRTCAGLSGGNDHESYGGRTWILNVQQGSLVDCLLKSLSLHASS